MDQSLSMLERVSFLLQSYGTQDVYATMDDLAGKLSVPDASKVYNAVWRLASQNPPKVEILKENVDGGARQKVVGVRLLKLEDPEEILERAAERALAHPATEKARSPLTMDELPAFTEYLRKRAAVEKAKELLADAGVDTSGIAFTSAPLGEDCIKLWDHMLRMQNDISNLSAENEVLRRKLSQYENSHRREPA